MIKLIFFYTRYFINSTSSPKLCTDKWSTFTLIRVVESGKGVISRAEVKLKAPIYNPEKVLCGGMNYADHCREQNAPIPKEPVFFSKFANAIVGTGDPIILNSQVKVKNQAEI